VRHTVEGAGAASWAIVLWWTAVILVLYLLTGCATARILPDGTMTCAAIGQGAKTTWSDPTGPPGVLTAAPSKAVACEGGPIVPDLLSTVGAVIGAVGKAIWGRL